MSINQRPEAGQIEPFPLIGQDDDMADAPQEKKVKLSFYAKPDLAKRVRGAAYKYRLTLEQFFVGAAERELERLEREPPKELDEKDVPDRLPKGRPLKIEE